MALIAAAGVVILAAVAGIMWVAGSGLGMRQAVEFFPYDEEVALDDGRTIRSSGVIVVINDREAFPDDRAMANLMLVAHEMYPRECSGENWEVAVRRPLPNGDEEKYSFYSSIYEVGEPGSWIELGRWTNGGYEVISSYAAEWGEIRLIARAEALFHSELAAYSL
jgi:hypothetical protein